jgi:hypothetical protein
VLVRAGQESSDRTEPVPPERESLTPEERPKAYARKFPLTALPITVSKSVFACLITNAFWRKNLFSIIVKRRKTPWLSIYGRDEAFFHEAKPVSRLVELLPGVRPSAPIWMNGLADPDSFRWFV